MPEATPSRWRFAIDRGGTFTDIVATAPDGSEQALKLLSESRAYADAAVAGMRALLEAPEPQPFPAQRVEWVKLGTTVATNALLERRGAKTLFVTTAGFADALLIGDQSRPELFALQIRRPPPLYAAVIEANERLDAAGKQVRPLDEAALAQALRQAAGQGFESVAIAFVHADLNPAHEEAAARLARAAGFSWVSVSSEVSPLPRFIPRAETCVADAYLTPVVAAYARRLEAALAGAPLFFMTSGGALAKAGAFRGRDAVLSGPAGGVVGVAETARAHGLGAALGFDMGGTSTDVCRFAGALERRDQALTAGVAIRAPRLDVETVAAGGGSILSFDGLRARSGPESAGADPGPAAYGRGGPATITDANLVLKRLDPAFFPSVFGPEGKAPLDIGAARAAVGALAERMGAEPEDAARGFVAIAAEQAAAAIRKISIERGFDPRGHALIAFGGAAGQLACEVAQALSIGEVLCPRRASELSAWGIGRARLKAVRQAGLERPLDEAGMAAAESLARQLEAEARADLAGQGVAGAGSERRLALRYAEADAALGLAWAGVDEARSAFEAAHARLFGFTEPDREILIASVEAEAEEAEGANPSPGFAGPPPAPFPAFGRTSPIGAGGPRRGGGGAIKAEDLTGLVDGPRLVVRGDTQIWVAEGWRAAPGPEGLIRLTRAASAAAAPPASSDKPDPVTLELFNRRFMAIAEAMGAALERTARSVNIKERLDFSCALFDADGGLVANAPHMPVHLGSMDASVRAVRARHPELQPGEAFALNNPYAGGTHLPDITVVMPVFLNAAAPLPASPGLPPEGGENANLSPPPLGEGDRSPP
ncbi:MAG TPA: hydantoinase/oxoprolinase family protein, partial [Caulobacteraceae bacterium]|nr:hydantoinase/oxoprolinase family protein [Caulobacteraceae bacterium]